MASPLRTSENPPSFFGDGEALARSPPDQKVNCSTVFSPVYLCHVPDVRNIREAVREE